MGCFNFPLERIFVSYFRLIRLLDDMGLKRIQYPAIEHAWPMKDVFYH